MDLELLGIPKNKINQFNNAEIYSIEDLVKYLPRKYYDFRYPYENYSNIDMTKTEPISIIGRISKVVKKEKLIYAYINDKFGNSLTIYWFNQPYIEQKLYQGKEYIFCGKLKDNPDYRQRQFFPLAGLFSSDIDSLKKIIPVYRKIKGMSDEYLLKNIKSALLMVDKDDFLEEKIIKEFNLISEYEAFQKIHNPKNDKDIRDAKYRFLFDDLFVFNFKLKHEELLQPKNSKYIVTACKSWTPLINKLKFELTEDQKKTLKIMYGLMKSGQRLNCLVQGDVGSGKTMIALFTAVLAKEHLFQSAIVAPTEVLAQQHYSEFISYMDEAEKDDVVLLIGSLKAKERKEVLKKIKNGEAKIIIGTHAVLQSTVEYNDLGLVCVDEQHRFGVKQREALLNRKKVPHLINMSATPIPRTMAMATYGNTIQVFNIFTKPNGRKPVITTHIRSDIECNKAIVKEVVKGHQVYIICPLIEDSESERMNDVESVQTCYLKLQKHFANSEHVKIDYISGDMKPKEIEEKIQKFQNGEFNVLISTTIVEVGVNIPNATLIIIKNSERFGLSTLHQLRGRVGRNSFQSYCMLQTIKDSTRATIMCSTTDGFKIAQEDLKLRDTGDFLGTKQSGSNKYVMLMLSNPQLYFKINELNTNIYADKNWYEKYSFLNEFDMFE